MCVELQADLCLAGGKFLTRFCESSNDTTDTDTDDDITVATTNNKDHQYLSSAQPGSKRNRKESYIIIWILQNPKERKKSVFIVVMI